MRCTLRGWSRDRQRSIAARRVAYAYAYADSDHAHERAEPN
ncbi:hypothetical protein [Nocardioides sp. NPDC006303]